MRAEIQLSTVSLLAGPLGPKLPTEQHKRHKIYTGSGHHCGVIPYSSVWCGGLPLGLDDEQYKAEQPREGLFLAGATNCWEEFNRSIYWFLGEDPDC